MNRQAALAWLAILATIGAFFGSALLGGRPLVFRDSAHFYYPLFEWCCREWAAGRVPLWNPYENCGTPVLADATSSVLYPGKLVFCLPLAYDTCFNLYIILHTGLAAGSCYRAARAWRASEPAAALAAIAYSCGGAVLFQYCNIVFLIGAAWLPLALLYGERMLRRGQLTVAIRLGLVMALMVLGGDPQAAYHVLLSCLVYIAVLAWRRPIRTWAQRRVFWFHRCGLCAAAAAVAFGLAAAQILPSIEATARSDRAAFNRPRNIYEAARVAWQKPKPEHTPPDLPWQSIGSGLFGEPELHTHHEAVFEFSVGPWRLAEVVWPNIGGRLFPTDRRWFSLLPAEQRIWTPTLYLGLLPAVLAIGAVCQRSSSGRERWLKSLLALAIIGSLGFYGVGWLVHELVGASGIHSRLTDSIGNPVGGLYWLMTTLLPGYVYFRYPAKLLPLAAVAICLLAAKAMDRVVTRREAWIVTALVFLAVISGCAAITVWAMGQRLFANVTSSDATLGPFDAAGARRDVVVAFVHAMAIASSFALLIQWAIKQPQHARKLQWIAVLLTAADVWVANCWTVVSPARLDRNAQPSLALQIRADPLLADSQNAAPRVFRGNLATWRPPTFRSTRSNNRLAQLQDWERQTLLPKYPLLDNISVIETHGSIASADYQALLYVAKQHGPRQSDKSLTPQPTLLRLLATKYLVLPESHQVEFATRIEHSAEDWHQSAALWRMHRTMPRCWVVHDVAVLPQLEQPLRMSAVEDRSREVLFPEGRPRDFARSAVIEADHPAPEWISGRANVGPPGNTTDTCKIVHDSPQRIVVDVNTSQAGLFVLADAFDPGWTALVTSGDAAQKATIYRTDRVLRGVLLAAGQQTIEFRYQPRNFYIGAAISAVSWLALSGLLISRFFHRHKATFFRSNNSAPA